LCITPPKALAESKLTLSFLIKNISSDKLIIPDGKEYKIADKFPEKTLPKIILTKNTIMDSLTPSKYSAVKMKKLDNPSLAPGINNGGNNPSTIKAIKENAENKAVSVSFLVLTFIRVTNN